MINALIDIEKRLPSILNDFQISVWRSYRSSIQCLWTDIGDYQVNLVKITNLGSGESVFEEHLAPSITRILHGHCELAIAEELHTGIKQISRCVLGEGCVYEIMNVDMLYSAKPIEVPLYAILVYKRTTASDQRRTDEQGTDWQVNYLNSEERYAMLSEFRRFYPVANPNARTIEKKVLPEFFEKIITGQKKFELRLADFEIGEGDYLNLVEWDGIRGGYTGRSKKVKVKYALKTNDVHFWSKDEIQKNGFVIIGF